MKRLFALVAAAMLAIAPAAADDAKRMSWTGFHLGAHAGMDITKTDVGLGPLGVDGLASDGLAAGVHGGYDLHLTGSPIVVGIGADYTWSNTEFAVTPGILAAGIDHSWSAHGRLGIAFGHVLPYVLAGYSEASARASIMGTPIGGTTLKGWVGGGGIELVVAPNVTVAGEYRFTRFDGEAFGGGALTLDTDRHEVRAALRYRFNPL